MNTATEGVSYALTQHGFARDMDFELMFELKMKCVIDWLTVRKHARNILSRLPDRLSDRGKRRLRCFGVINTEHAKCTSR